MVTRVTTAEDMGQQIQRQMFNSPKALAIAAAILVAMGAVPGMPHVSFVGLGLLAAGGAYWIWRRGKAEEEAKKEEQGGSQADQLPAPASPEQRELGWEDVTPVDMVGLEVGYRLIPLVDRNQGGQLRSEEHTSELQSRPHLVCRLLLEKKKHKKISTYKHNHRVRISINASNALTTTKHDIISTSDAGL